MQSWGRLPGAEQQVIALDSQALALPTFGAQRSGLAYGNGRSYGDVCLNPGGGLWSTQRLDHLIAFDPQSGILECEAGVLLRDIQRLMIPRGWMLPVTPGTQLVTIGGAIANDVHGKNHHRAGSFGDHVQRLHLLRTSGETIHCGPAENPQWFSATVGGLGLTGVIMRASVQLRRVPGPWLDTRTLPYGTPDELFALADQAEADWEHTVSWLDCINSSGRGVFMCANHVAHSAEPPPVGKALSVPFVPPLSLVNALSLRPFNIAYYQLQTAKAERQLVHYEKYSYPLDNLLDWNRIYGPKGFYQYQSVVPRAVGSAAIRAMLKEIARTGDGSFLSVLKTFGNRQAVGMLSFPTPGVTLALDFPNKGARTLALFERLDAIVREAGGRLYPAKDARMPRDLFESGYPRLDEFMQYRDPGISSAMSRRLMGS